VYEEAPDFQIGPRVATHTQTCVMHAETEFNRHHKFSSLLLPFETTTRTCAVPSMHPAYRFVPKTAAHLLITAESPLASGPDAGQLHEAAATTARRGEEERGRAVPAEAGRCMLTI